MDAATTSGPTQAAIRRFPLLGRPRPACPALTDRIAEVVEIAANAAAHNDNSMAEAAHALNKAALIASDCGLPDLAQQWCWQHINVYQRLGTLTALQASYLLEPVLNLARLQIRANDGQPALQLLQAMYKAVASGTDLHVDGHPLPLANLTGPRDELRQLYQWTWLQYLSDGIRILALSGRWDDAVHHANTLNGIGQHLMEGRQATIIAEIVHQNPDSARAILDGSTVTQPWEHQVASCLAAMCPALGTVDQKISTMVDQFHAHGPLPGYAVYRARWGITAATVASGHRPLAAQVVLNRVVTEVLDAPDGYAAREILGHRSGLQLKAPQQEALTHIVAAAGLGARAIPEPMLEALAKAACDAEGALTASIE